MTQEAEMVPAAEPSIWISADEIALRVRKHRKWVYARAKDRTIPSEPIGPPGRGRRWLFPRRAVEQWLSQILAGGTIGADRR